MIRVASLHLYPVKSLQGIEVTKATVERRGLVHDRRFMVVDRDGLFMTQRKMAKMAQLGVKIADRHLRLSWEGEGASVPLEGEGPAVTVRVWGSEVAALHVSGADEFLSSVLRTDCRLVRMPESSIRPTVAEYSRTGDHVSFADGFPVLLANLASLDDLNRRMEAPVPMARFRPNLVIEGAAAWEEDEMESLTVGEVPFRNVKPCIRCSVTTLDHRTGESRGPEPLATLAKFRRLDQGVAFGSNLIPDGEGSVRVGDPISPGRL